MQAITTKYLSATDFLNARIKATCQAGTLTLPWDDALDSEANHDAAAIALADKLGWREGWHGDMVRGALPSGNGNVYVFTSRHATIKGKNTFSTKPSPSARPKETDAL